MLVPEQISVRIKNNLYSATDVRGGQELKVSNAETDRTEASNIPTVNLVIHSSCEINVFGADRRVIRQNSSDSKGFAGI